MKQLQVLIRPFITLLALVTLTPAVVQVSHGFTPVQIAGDDPKIPTGG